MEKAGVEGGGALILSIHFYFPTIENLKEQRKWGATGRKPKSHFNLGHLQALQVVGFRESGLVRSLGMSFF